MEDKTITCLLDFTNVGDGEGQTPAEGPGYRWSGDEAGGYRLELNGIQMNLSADTSEKPPAITLPTDGKTEVWITGENSIIAPGRGVIMPKATKDPTGFEGSNSISVQGSGTLETVSASGPFSASRDLMIKDVTIRATTTQSGIRSQYGTITLDSVDFCLKSDANSSSCIQVKSGKLNIKNSKLDLTSDKFPTIHIEGEKMLIADSEVNVSSGYHSGIYVGNTSGQEIVVSGQSKVTVECTGTSSYGIFLHGKLTVGEQAELTASSTSAALAVFEGITLENTAVISPADGVITPPIGNSNIYTIRSGQIAATSVTIQPAALDVSLDQPVCTYGSTVNAAIAFTPGLTADFAILEGDKKIADGSTAGSSPIAIDTKELGAGVHTLTVKLQEDKGNVAKDIALTVEKAQPNITGPTAADVQYGQQLSAAALSGGTAAGLDGAALEGTWSWKDGEVLPTVNNSGYPAVFTPKDANYSTAEAIVPLSVGKAQNAPNMPDSVMDVLNSCEKVSDVTLPEGWEWQASDKDTPLEAGTAVSVTAVYTGADKGNYENETVKVAITRAGCVHQAGDILFTGAGEKAPSCTEDGTGHTECMKCGSVMEAGVAVKALGHTYTEQITQEPTAYSEGIRTYTCTRCGHSYTKPIAKLPGSGSSSQSGYYPGNYQPSSQPVNQSGTATSKPDDAKPFIKDQSGREGWDVIKAEAETAVAAPEGGTVAVDMNGATVVPGSVLASIKDSEATMVFDLDSIFTWSVDGKDIKSEAVSDTDLSVKAEAGAIPKDVVDSAAGDLAHMELHLAHEGTFGFDATLSIDFASGNGSIVTGSGAQKNYTGMYANLFYYNPSLQRLEFICADKIGEDGKAQLLFAHASDYSVILSEQPMGSTGDPQEPGGQENPQEPEKPQQPEEQAKVKSVKLSKTVYTYSGKAKKPSVIAIDTKGERIPGKYYTVSYKNNKKAGKAAVTVVFQGAYSGTVKRAFTIRPAGTSIKKLQSVSGGLTVKWKTKAAQTSGYQIQYCTNAQFKGNSAHSAFVKKASIAKRTIKKLETGKVYYVRIRTYKTVKESGESTRIFSAWSSACRGKTI